MQTKLFLERYESSETELEKSYDHWTDGLNLQSKVQCYEKGERPSKYFLTREKSREAKTHLRKVRSSQNLEEIVDPQLICSELRTFYSSLHTRKSITTEQKCLAYRCRESKRATARYTRQMLKKCCSEPMKVHCSHVIQWRGN